jgi:hypothetical protein
MPLAAASSPRFMASRNLTTAAFAGSVPADPAEVELHPDSTTTRHEAIVVAKPSDRRGERMLERLVTTGMVSRRMRAKLLGT